ncbi:TonB-dependent receptor [Aliiglaciecola sp. CAU 1673]|uniref:TonB-dependent receptor n=1 Tax=Aliiglaciecola sp. CAU 1673 TaxID=3032595 RepID=UPI0023DCE3BD|nr:TonB-dependent receptor [Aliiglaciecola sp. CAU 1673]MDF2178578.1 TonB-dependent receptor [Aliiglaciecola sp. CAU 1673]
MITIKGFRSSTLAVSVSAALFAITNPTIAQETDQTSAQKTERIQVTGSRIKRADLEGPSPITMITREDIDSLGFENLQQILERLPVAGAGTFSTRNNSQDSTANGGAAVSLRGFGADATLVLVNGRRVAISAFAESIVNSFVDINSIPVAAIERIDILKDGASAIYGSDAVAGVVNIVLRKDYVGTEVTAGYGQTTGPDYDENTFSAVWGTGNEDSNATLIFDYFKNASIDNSELGRFGTANQSPYGGMDFRSSRGYPGYFYVNGVKTIDPACPPENATASGSCLYDYGPHSIAIPAAERIGAILQMNKRFSNDIELFTEIAVQHNTSEAGGAATPLDEDAGLTAPGSHPNNPFGQDVEIGRYRPVDAGNRRWDIESDSLRVVAGLRGSIDTWDWEVSGQKGRSRSMQTGDRSQGWVRTDFLQQEIDAGRYNPFGGVTNPQSVIDAITTSLVRRGESHLTSFDAHASGDLFEFDGRTIALAVGYEYREEDVSDIPDDQFQRGLIFGTESVSAQAARDQWAVYAELSIPLHDTFELQVAGRHDDYSDFGSTTNPKIAMRWTPTEDISVRASWSEGFRAPSLAQIGLGPSQESQFFVDNYFCDLNPSVTDKAACRTESLDYTIVFAGNPDLKPEESETWNVGVIWAFAENADVGFDVWSITQDNKIDERPFGAIYDRECNNQNSTICQRLTPLPGDVLGPFSQLNNSYFNVSSQEAQGIDFSAHYGWDLADFGNLGFSLEWSYLTNFEKDGRDWTGEYEFPEHRWVSTIDWTRGDWSATAAFSYVGEFEDTPDIDFDGTLDFDQNNSRMVDSQLLLDLQVAYMYGQQWKFMLGMNNALDEDPPFAIGDGDDDLFGYATKVHSPRGRYIYGKASYRF